MQRCDFRDLRECSCVPNECRVQGVYVKPRPSPHNTTGWQCGIVFIFAALSISYAATIGYEQQKRMDIIAQEQGR